MAAWKVDELAVIVVLYRLAMLWLLGTSYMPDEYFQFIEPANRLATGLGIE